jgi:hypothetical protein
MPRPVSRAFSSRAITADEKPTYAGSIRQFRTNRTDGFLVGEAFVASYLPMPRFYPNQGELVSNPAK